MVRRIYGKKYLIIIMLIPLVSTPIYGLVQISNSAENVIKNMEPSSLCEFTENGEGTIYSSDGVKLWANDFPGYEDSFSLVGVLRDGVQLSDNTITAKYKKELLAKEKEYNVWQGSSSIANTASDVHITLNHGLNEGLYQYMIDNGATKGTVCAMDVKTGELLAMVSLPATIPSESVDLSSLEDSALVNKNLSVMVPGSTIKIFTTALLYEVGGIDTINNLLFTCDGNYILADHSAVTCGTRRGYKNISAAIGTSCNAFFAYSIRNILDQKSKDTQNKLVDFGFQLLPTKNHYVALDKLLRLQSKTYYSGFGYQSTWSLIGQQSQVSPIDA